MELFISLRYLRGRKKGFLNLITNISINGVILGTMVLVIALSIANGMEKEVRDRIVGTFAHGRVSKYHSEAIENYDSLRAVIELHPKVIATSPTIMGKGAVEYKSLQEGIMINAIDDSLEQGVSELHKKLIDSLGSFSLAPAISKRNREFPGVIIGTGLAHKFGVTSGNELVLMSLVTADGEMDPMPKMMRFTITGVFETGMYEYDQMLVYIDFEVGKKFFEMDGAEFINFKCENMFDATQTSYDLEDSLGYPYKLTNWEKQNQSLFQWMKLEKLIIFIVISLIVIVAAFNIASTLIMMIMDKRREIGILMSMGATRGSIMKIFIINGMIIGLYGSTIGTTLGFIISSLQKKYHFLTLPGDVYFIDFLPILMRPSDIIMIFGVTNVVCVLAALYPAWQASKLLPAEAVRLD